MKINDVFVILIGFILSSCLNLDGERSKASRWVKADSCNCFVLDSFATNHPGKHKYEILVNGDSLFTVYDTLGYKYFSTKSVFYSDGLIKSVTNSAKAKDESFESTLSAKFYLNSERLFKTEYYYDFNRLEEDFSHSIFLSGKDIITLNTLNIDDGNLTIDIEDVGFIINKDSKLSFSIKSDPRSKTYFELDYSSKGDYVHDCHSVVIFPIWDKMIHTSLISGDLGPQERFDIENLTSDWGYVSIDHFLTDSMYFAGISDRNIPLKFSKNTPKEFRIVVGSDNLFEITDFKLEVFERLGGNDAPETAISNSRQRNSIPWQSYGSGIILSKEGYLITNYHVIDEASDLEIGLVEDNKIRYYSGEIISRDKNNDLALLRINDLSFKEFKVIPYNLSGEQSNVGKEIFALGYPLTALLGDELKFTDGRVSARSGIQGDISKYQMTVPLQPGNSGGPVFDFDGNLIGIAQGGIKKDIAEDVTYCVKSSYVNSLVGSLPQKFDLPDDRSNRGDDVEDIIKRVAPYVALIRVR